MSSRLCNCLSGITAAVFLCALPALALAQEPENLPRVIHVFVALCDNDSQGIVPVPRKIGNGDDPAANLYWGCDEGVRSQFNRSKAWRKAEAKPAAAPEILERLAFSRGEGAEKVWLIADAYRGREIRRAIRDFFEAAAGRLESDIEIEPSAGGGPAEIQAGGRAALAVYLGHNGLMEFSVDPEPAAEGADVPSAIVLCCKSRQYFTGPLELAGARPILLTTQLMYPGGFLLKDVLEGWIRDETPEMLLDRAARSYAENQSISVKAARGVFSAGW